MSRLATKQETRNFEIPTIFFSSRTRFLGEDSNNWHPLTDQAQAGAGVGVGAGLDLGHLNILNAKISVLFLFLKSVCFANIIYRFLTTRTYLQLVL